MFELPEMLSGTHLLGVLFVALILQHAQELTAALV